MYSGIHLEIIYLDSRYSNFRRVILHMGDLHKLQIYMPKKKSLNLHQSFKY